MNVPRRLGSEHFRSADGSTERRTTELAAVSLAKTGMQITQMTSKTELRLEHLKEWCRNQFGRPDQSVRIN